MSKTVPVRFREMAATALAYYALGWAGLIATGLQVTPVWPPSGVALAVALIFGYRIWPGIWTGAFLLKLWNSFDSTRVFVSLVVTAGNATAATLAALTGAYLIFRFAGGLRCLDRARSAFGFMLYGAVFSTIVAATGGVASMLLGGVIPLSAAVSIWFTWWMGDISGVLIFAPLILLFHSDRTLFAGSTRIGEATLLIIVLTIVGLAAFGESTPSQYQLHYMLLPCLVWAAFRFHLRGAVLVTAVISCMAIWATIRGYGPFHTGERTESLLALQAFMDVTALTTLMLSALLTERRDKAEEMIRAIQEAQEAHILELKDAELKLRKSEQMELLGRLVSAVAHEVRSPLFAITTAAQILHKKSPAETGQYATLILEQVERLKNLTVDLLEIGRPSTAWLMSENEIHQLMRSARDHLVAATPEAEKRLSIPSSTNRLLVRGNPDKLQQVFHNVFENAVQHSSENSNLVEIEVEESSTEITVRVKDSGPGIPPENIEKLFQPFFTTRKGGVGLGLVIAKQTLEAHNGRIRVYNNTAGPGCTFEVILPRSNPAQENALKVAQ